MTEVHSDLKFFSWKIINDILGMVTQSFTEEAKRVTEFIFLNASIASAKGS
jgi:hypothetical protein